MNRSGPKLPPGRPGPNTRGKPTPVDVRRRREADVEAVYLATGSVRATARLLAERWGTSLTTTKRDVNRVRARWAAEAQELDPADRREESRRALLQDISAARVAGRWSAVMQGRRLLAELDGQLVERRQSVVAHVHQSPLHGQPREVLEFVRSNKRMPDEQERAALLALPAKRTN